MSRIFLKNAVKFYFIRTINTEVTNNYLVKKWRNSSFWAVPMAKLKLSLIH